MSKARIVNNLNLNWKFFRGDEPKGWYKGYNDSNWRDISLPHDWSLEKGSSIDQSCGSVMSLQLESLYPLYHALGSLPLKNFQFKFRLFTILALDIFYPLQIGRASFM